MVEITNGAETLRQLSNGNGTFSFQDIRPGSWVLKVYAFNLPAYHYLEKEDFQLELKPGEAEELTPRVLPRLRPIQIIDAGELIE